MRPRIAQLWILLLLLAAISCLVAFGIAGVDRPGIFNFDGRVLFAAGRAWLRGQNPYDFAQLSAAVAGILPGFDTSELRFLYPPQSSALCIPLALVSYPVARILWLGANIAALGIIVAITMDVLRQEKSQRRTMAAAIIAALIIGNPFTAHVFWLGQTSLIAFVTVYAAWWLTERGSWLPAGICLGISLFKPQICVLVVVWFLLQRRWRELIIASLTAALMAIKPILAAGPVGALKEWMTGRAAYDSQPFNVPNFPHKIGLDTLFYVLGAHAPDWVFGVLAMACTFILWSARSRLVSIDILALLMIVTLTFSTYAHDYDYVALIPAFVTLGRIARESRPLAITGALLLLVLFVPQRLVSLAGIAVLDQWRTLTVIGLGVVIIGATRAAQRMSANERAVGVRG